MKVLVTGAAGFVGSHAVRCLIEAGHHVIGASRRLPKGERRSPDATYFDNVDIGDASTLRPEIFEGVDAVAHLVGIIRQAGPQQTFKRIHVDGTANVIAAAKASKSVVKLVYMSAIGSTAEAASEYSRTKAAAEQLVVTSGFTYIILRPSIILGSDGEFVEQMIGLVRHGGLPFPAPFPFIPVPGSGQSKFQPIYVDDLMRCLTASLESNIADNAIIEAGGATQVTFEELLKAFAARLGVRKPMLNAPIAALMAVAPLLEMLPSPPVTRDQLKNLSRDNICDIGVMKSVFGFEPMAFDTALDLSLRCAPK